MLRSCSRRRALGRAEPAARRAGSPVHASAGCILLASLLVPYAVLAQSLAIPVPTPKNIILPNYDNVLVGSVESVEAGAYLARTEDASACFYNPAGLARASQTALSASANGFVWSRLTSLAVGQTTSSSRIVSTPGFFALALGKPILKGDRLRLGFSITNAVSWFPAGIDEQKLLPGAGQRLTYSSSVAFSTTTTAVAAGYRVTRQVRLGLGVGLAHTSYSDQETFSGELPIAGQDAQFVSVLRANGDIYHVALSAGVQWDVAPQLTLGAVLRAPGIRLGASSLLTYESASQGGGVATSAYLRDDAGSFAYAIPLEVGVGVAYRFGPVQAEVDLRYHANTGQYTFYRASRPLQVNTQNPDGAVTASAQPFEELKYSSRAVTNVAVGASYLVGKALALHAGFFASFSPVGNASVSPFQQADLFALTAGAAFTGVHWSGSLGLAFESGSSTAVASSDASGQSTALDYRAVTLLYAVGYRF